MQKATRKGGRGIGKKLVGRHGSRMRGTARNAASKCEKAFETVTRREGKRECAEG
jgi:hypothetical protein